MASSFFDTLRRRAHEVPTAVAAIDGVASHAGSGAGEAAPPASALTYAELCYGAERLAGVLAHELAGVDALAGGAWKPQVPDAAVLATSMRRGSSWYCVFWAAARIQAPLVALSCDLPDAAIERRRNAEIVAEHRPPLLVADDAGLAPAEGAAAEAPQAATSIRRFAELWHRACSISALPVPHMVTSADATLCYCYTGGTTKASRCAKVSHRMAIFECEVYNQVVKMGCEDRVLQQHSMYWGASAYGEVDIALAFGCALVFAEAWDTENLVAEIRRHSVTCSGLVPSVLAAIEHRDVPTLRCVFTWGEALQARVAREWAKHVRLIDLLISTECWLSLYADWTASGDRDLPVFVTVPGTQVRLRPVQDGGPDIPTTAGEAASGELLVAGPMVSAGYTDEVLNAAAFEVDASGKQWYCTKDCLRAVPGGYRFAGRADDLVKVGGVWVDTGDVQATLRGLPGVSEACVCRRDAFVALRTLQDGVIAQLRGALPTDFALYIVPFLPKSAGTGKVDRRRLCDTVACRPDAELEVRESSLCAEELASIVAWYKPLWLLVASAAFSSRDALAWPWLDEDDPGAFAWGVLSILVSFACRFALDLCWRFLTFSYIILAAWHLPDRWQGYCGGIPCRELGVALSCGVLAPNAIVGAILAGPGVGYALRRGRLCSWPVVCALGAPIWLRDAGWWMMGVERSFVLQWYVRYWRSRLVPSWTWRELARNAAKRCRLLRYCSWCKADRPFWAGRVEKPEVPTSAPMWYCTGCWSHYHCLKKCDCCGKWATRGAPAPPSSQAAGEPATSAARWWCHFCIERPPALPAASADAAAPAASEAGSVPWTPMRATESNGAAQGLAPLPSIERRIISAPLPPPSPPRGAQGLRRPAEAMAVDGKAHPEQPPAKRLQVAAPSDAPPEAVDEAMGAEPTACAMEVTGVGGESPDDGGSASGAKRARTAEPARQAVAKSKEWLVIERSTGLVFDSPSDSLLGLDSLRHTKMTSALRRELGKKLPRQVLKNAGTLGALLKEIDRIPEEAAVTGTVARDSSRREEYAAWGMMWSSRCQWVLHVTRPISEPVFLEAVGRLVDRHAALRAELRDPYRMFALVQQALSTLVVWRRHGEQIARWLPAALRRRAECTARWALRSAWPRVGGVPPREGPFGLAAGREAQGIMVKVLDRSPNMQDAEWKLWNNARVFTPPFRAILAPYGAEGEEGAMLHLTVTHMLSDGYCVVPLLDDLASLVASVEASSATPSSPSSTASSSAVAPPRLPAVLDAFAALETRIHRTIDGTDDAGGLNPRITPHAIAGKNWRNAHTTFATLPVDTVAAIRAAATRLAVPDDIAMLTLLGVTLAWFTERRSQRVAMIVPQRDGPGENDMVGLFSDVRHLSLCTNGLSIAGVALRLHHVVKERLWTVPELRTQFELPLLNFEWTDFQEKQGFAQHVTCGERAESSFHPLRVAVDQPHRDTWRLRVAFQEGAYDARQRDAFFELFERSLGMLRYDPLALVWD